jgi:hypothetical protein
MQPPSAALNHAPRLNGTTSASLLVPAAPPTALDLARARCVLVSDRLFSSVLRLSSVRQRSGGTTGQVILVTLIVGLP